MITSCVGNADKNKVQNKISSASVTNVTSTKANGTYKTGDIIDISVTFSTEVKVTGSPRLSLETGTANSYAVYSSGSGTNTLKFNYTIGSGGFTNKLDYSGVDALELNGGTITVGRINAILTLPASGEAKSFWDNKSIAIDTTAPEVTNVTSFASNGYYKTSASIDVVVIFSEAVSVTGSPRILLETGLNDRYATYTSGSGTNELIFAYSVQAGDTSADLDYKSTSALSLNGGTIVDNGLNSAILTLATPSATSSLGANKSLLIDAVIATVTNVSSLNVDGTYSPGFALTVLVAFSEPVTVTGSPQIALALGSTRQAIYSSGSGSNTLYFTYTIQPEDTTSDLDYTSTSALGLNAGTIKDNAGNSASLILSSPATANSLGGSKAIVIPDSFKPVVLSVSSSKSNGTYSASTQMDISITFSEAVTVTGTPRLLLETGITNRYATYSNGSGSTTLIFSYTVLAGDSSSDLDYESAAALELNAGTINDNSGNSATLNLSTPASANSLGANKAIIVDTTSAAVTNVTSSSANGTYRAGTIINVTVTFSEAVTVTGSPRILLETGTTDRYATYSSGSGLNALNFSYTALAGDTSSDLDYVTTTSLELNGGTIFDAGLNGATLTLANPSATNSLANNKSIIIDTTLPSVTSITASNVNATYGVGTTLTITATFSEVVTVTGAPQISLALGSTRKAVYSGGTGTSVLSFSYTTVASDTTSDLDYISSSALEFNSGTINDIAGNSANLTLATPGAANSLGQNKDIVIDGVSSVVTNVTALNANGSYASGVVLTINVTFSEVVNVTSVPQIALNLGTTRLAGYSAGTGTNTLSFTYTTQAGDTTSDLEYSLTTALTLNSGTITDSSSNSATLILPVTGFVNSLKENKAIVIDTTNPTITNITSTNANGTYGIGNVLTVTATFSEAVLVTGAPYIELSLGSTRQASYTAGTGTTILSFTYTVQATDFSSDLDYIGTTAMALNTGTIRDSVGNNATLTLAAPAATFSLGANKAIAIDGVAPDISSLTVVENAPYSAYRNSTTTTPAFSWSGYSLAAGESYDYCINSIACTASQSNCNIVNWTSNSTANSKTAIVLGGLTNNSDNFSCVRAKDSLNNISSVVSSNGWIVDVIEPIFSGAVTVGADPSTLTSTPTVTFPAATDTGGSGIDYYEYCVRLSTSSVGTGCTWTKMTTSSGVAVTGLWHLTSTIYRVDLRAVDNASNRSLILSSPPWTTPNPTWEQQAYIKAGNNDGISDVDDKFGTSISLDNDTLAVGAPFEDSSQITITNGLGTSTDEGASASGAVYIYKRTGTTWAKQAYIKAANGDANDYFGYGIDLDNDTLVVGAMEESSDQITITNGTTASSDNSSDDSGAAYVYQRTGTNWAQQAFLKASNSEEDDMFGYRVSISGDTIVVGSFFEGSNQTTITNGATSSSDNSNYASGAAYVYKRTGTSWAQEAYIKGVNSNASDSFGYEVSLYNDTIAIGAVGEDSVQTTITNATGASSDNSNIDSGAVYIYKRTGTSWVQEAYIKAANSGSYDSFGEIISLYEDTLAVGAPEESSNQTSITNGSSASNNNSNIHSGAVYVYKRSGSTWVQQAYLKAGNNNAYDYFGASVGVYGNLLAVGAIGERSDQITITTGTGSSTNNDYIDSGAVYVYRYNGSVWAQEAFIKSKNNNAGDQFGVSLSVSDNTIAIGASTEDSDQNTISTTTASSSDLSPGSGAVYIYRFAE